VLEVKSRQLRPECHSMDMGRGDSAPSHKRLVAMVGVVVTCHSWAWTLVPPIHLERGPVLGFKPSGAVLLVGTHGRNVRLFKLEHLPLLLVLS